MRAIVFHTPGPIDRPGALADTDLPDPPAPTGHDLLVEVKAVSVNPVDVKVRASATPADAAGRVLGFDAAGTVVAVGPEAAGFRPGDDVAYAGSLPRPGSNAQFQLVDARIVGRKPASIGYAEAAALPLTAITAWEMLFDRLDVARPVPGAAPAVLVIGGAGGVGSIAIQLLRQRTGLTVLATASRPETRDWVGEMGAHHVIDHAQPLAPQIAALGLGAPGFVFSTTQTKRHLADIAELIAPQGRFGLIDDPDVLDINIFKRKAVSVHWEFMFTRPIFTTADIAEQAALLNEVAEMVDAGTLRSTMTERLSPIDAATLTHAHRLVESGRMRGKVVIEGWS